MDVWGWSRVPAVGDSAAVNRGVRVSFQISFAQIKAQEFCPDKGPGLALLEHMATLFLVHWGTSVWFSIVALPHIPINSVGGFPFLHTLYGTSYL